MAKHEPPEWAHFFSQTLMQALRERDPYTYGHCRRVAKHAKLLAKAAALPEFQCHVIELAALFHDLGKIGIPDSILLKPGRLTPQEREIMHEHPAKSADIIRPLSRIEIFGKTLPGILHHHERMDGLGYPHQIKGDQIPLEARILLIADTFDAMTTTRPYRKALSAETAYKELTLFSGRQFDPHLVKIFIDAHPTWDNFEEEITEEFVARNFKRAA